MISGKQGSGKSTIMDAVIKLSIFKGMNAMDVRFAETIYNIHDYIRETLRFRGIERPDKDGRLLQLLGTEWGRETIHPDIWVKALLGYINNVSPVPKDNQLFVISDCRFRNEFDLVDAFKIRLECDRDIRKERCDGWRDTDTHISETDLDEYSASGKFDMYINTASTNPADVAELIYKEYLCKQKLLLSSSSEPLEPSLPTSTTKKSSDESEPNSPAPLEPQGET
jgi:hypothetical protein